MSKPSSSSSPSFNLPSASKSPRVANLTTSVGDMSINKGISKLNASSRAQRKSKTRKCTKRQSLKKVPRPDTTASRQNRQNQQKDRRALVKKKRSAVSRGGKPVRVGSRQQPTRKAKEESPYFALSNITPADVADARKLPLPPPDVESGL